jgi:hypothetical protein
MGSTTFELDLFLAFVAGVVTLALYYGREVLPAAGNKAADWFEATLTEMREVAGYILALIIGGCAVVAAVLFVRSVYQGDGESLPLRALTAPRDISSSVLELALAFSAGAGTTLGARYGRKERSENRKRLKDDPGGRFALWVLGPIMWACAVTGTSLFVGGMVYGIVWALPHECQDFKRRQPEIQEFNRTMRDREKQKDLERMIRQRLDKAVHDQDADRKNEGKKSIQEDAH